MGIIAIKSKVLNDYFEVSGIDSIRQGDIFRFYHDDGTINDFNSYTEFYAKTGIFFNDATKKMWIDVNPLDSNGNILTDITFGFDVQELKTKLGI